MRVHKIEQIDIFFMYWSKTTHSNRKAILKPLFFSFLIVSYQLRRDILCGLEKTQKKSKAPVMWCKVEVPVFDTNSINSTKWSRGQFLKLTRKLSHTKPGIPHGFDQSACSCYDDFVRECILYPKINFKNRPSLDINWNLAEIQLEKIKKYIKIKMFF